MLSAACESSRRERKTGRGRVRAWGQRPDDKCFQSHNRRKSNQERKLGRTGYKGRRIVINNVRKARRNKILMTGIVSNISAEERPTIMNQRPLDFAISRSRVAREKEVTQ